MQFRTEPCGYSSSNPVSMGGAISAASRPKVYQQISKTEVTSAPYSIFFVLGFIFKRIRKSGNTSISCCIRLMKKKIIPHSGQPCGIYISFRFHRSPSLPNRPYGLPAMLKTAVRKCRRIRMLCACDSLHFATHRIPFEYPSLPYFGIFSSFWLFQSTSVFF